MDLTHPARGIALAALACASLALPAARAATLQPGEATSQDVLLYKFAVGGSFGIPTPPRTTNLDTATLNMISPPPVPFGSFLGAAVTDPFTATPGGPLREHDTRSLLRFDLAGLGLTADRVAHATLGLFALPALPPFESPDAAHPVTTDIRRVTGAWNEQTVTWDSQPTTAAAPSATTVQSGVGRFIRFDVTDLVRDWLANPAANFGLQVSQRDIVDIPGMGPGARDRYFGSLYASSAGDAAQRPFLSITEVPEPATLALLGAGLLGLGAARRHKA